MEIIFLGTSSAIHSHTRSHPSIIFKGFGEIMLFDCGEATQKQLIFAKVSPMKISKIFLTHYHGDHILGLPGLLQSMNFRDRQTPLTIYGPKGIKRLKKAIELLNLYDFNFPLEFIKLKNKDKIENEKYTIKTKKVNHSIETLAYSIEEKKKPKFLRDKAIQLGVPIGPLFGKLHRGEPIQINNKTINPSQVLGKTKKTKKIVYSGDTTPCEEMINFAKNCDLLIHDSTYKKEDKDKAQKNFHSTSYDAANIAKKANAKKLILTHISTRYKDNKDLLKQAQAKFPNTIIANDLMKIEV